MTTDVSAFERLGGAEGVGLLVQGLYDRVLADPELAKFFAGSDMDRLRHMQAEFVATALGGPSGLAPSTIHQAHVGRGVRARHYVKFLEHFLATLSAAGLDEADIDRILERMAIAAPDVIDEVSEDG